ncbi:glycosyltransferase family 61 protein [Rhizobium sp. CFBP 8762]|uniref:glycosyltransferase family 61 protein n=1 Tax=Rhizobium sp. CFBP 8762 TaxID=2775279 RepID=UPI0017843D31|nr:glycosyltransferase family 61 protein [Rhizobium sp. CFBP 8762]MBD8555639.1 glycosyltransferase family 61 protein [Rhizobium sp. CFBP 8762]
MRFKKPVELLEHFCLILQLLLLPSFLSVLTIWQRSSNSLPRYCKQPTLVAFPWVIKDLSKRTLYELTQIAAEQRWRDIISATADDELLKREPRIISLRLEAALEAGDDRAVNHAVEIATVARMRAEQRYATIRPLLKFTRPAEAWTVLSADLEIRSHPGFVKQASRVLRFAKGHRSLQTAIRACLIGILPTTIWPRKSAYTYEDNIHLTSRAFGTVDVFRSPQVEQKHVEGLLSQRNTYYQRAQQPRQPRIAEYRDVFIDRHGQVWSENEDIILTTGQPKPAIDREQCVTVDLAVSGLRGTRGIYHWLVDDMPHFAWVNPALGHSGLTVLMAKDGPSFEQDSLHLAGFSSEQIHFVSDVVFVRRLLLPRISLGTLRYWPKIGGIYEAIARQANLLAEKNAFDAPTKIYISRRDGVRRPLTNETEVERYMHTKGYTVVTMSELPLWKQIHIATKAKSIVAPHGAGLTHIIFSKPGMKILELLPIKDGSYLLRFNYARLSMVLGHDYQAWLEPQLPLTEPWSVDFDSFSNFFEQWDNKMSVTGDTQIKHAVS